MILTNVQRFARRVSLRSFGGALLLVTLVLSAAGCGPTLNSLPSGSGDISSGSAQWPASGGLPRPDHIVIVVEENHSFEQIVGSTSAPYINSLAVSGALFTNAHAVEHPSQPNYLDLFSGSNQGVTSDACPQSFSTPNLASELISKGLTFGGYAEDLPDIGSEVCTAGGYARKHAPWVNFSNVPKEANMPMSAFPTDYSKLPTVSFIIPTLDNDMHNGSIQQGDNWLRDHISGYLQWAKKNNSLLVVTWDENDSSPQNAIATIFVGPMVKQGEYTASINHLNVLRTLEDMYGLAHVGSTGDYDPIVNMAEGSGQAEVGAVADTANKAGKPAVQPVP